MNYWEHFWKPSIVKMNKQRAVFKGLHPLLTSQKVNEVSIAEYKCLIKCSTMVLIIPHQCVMKWLFSEDQIICDAERMGVHYFSLIWTLSLLSTGSLDVCSLPHRRDFPGGSDCKASACNVGDLGLIPGSGRSLEKEMATHSGILTWKIPWTEDPGRLQSMRSQRVGHDGASSLFPHKRLSKTSVRRVNLLLG